MHDRGLAGDDVKPRECLVVTICIEPLDPYELVAVENPKRDVGTLEDAATRSIGARQREAQEKRRRLDVEDVVDAQHVVVRGIELSPNALEEHLGTFESGEAETPVVEKLHGRGKNRAEWGFGKRSEKNRHCVRGDTGPLALGPFGLELGVACVESNERVRQMIGRENFGAAEPGRGIGFSECDGLQLDSPDVDDIVGHAAQALREPKEPKRVSERGERKVEDDEVGSGLVLEQIDRLLYHKSRIERDAYRVIDGLLAAEQFGDRCSVSRRKRGVEIRGVRRRSVRPHATAGARRVYAAIARDALPRPQRARRCAALS